MMTIWVSPDGDDAAAGTFEAPVATLAGAVAKLPAEGGRIRLGPGVYPHGPEVTIDRPVRILGAGMDQTILRGAVNSSWQVYIHHAAGVRVRDLTFDVDDACGTGERGAVRMEHVRDVEVRRVRFVRPSAVGLEVGVFDGGQYSSAIVNEDIRVRDCEFVDISPGSTREQALFLNTRGLSVHRCRFLCCDGVALQIGREDTNPNNPRPYDCTGIVVESCTFAHNNRLGLDPLLHPDVFFTHIPEGHDLQARISRCVFRNANPKFSLSTEPAINNQRQVTGLVLEENDSDRESALVVLTPA